MAFPFSYYRKKTFYIYTEFDEIRQKIEHDIKEKIKEGYLDSSESSDDTIIFSGPIFRFVWNGWNIFNGISKGEFTFDYPDDNKFVIESKYYFFEPFIICLLFSCLSAIMFITNLMLFAWIWLAIVWLLVYTGNYFLCYIRINSFIDDNIKKHYNDLIKSTGIDEEELKRIYHANQELST